MAPIIILCLQLIIVGLGGGTSSSSWTVSGLPSSSSPVQDPPRYDALLATSSVPPGRPSPSINISKRQSGMPLLIEAGDRFSYRQQHQPIPEDGGFPYEAARQDLSQTHFRQRPPAHLLNHQRHQPHLHGAPIQLMIGQPDYEQPAPLLLAESSFALPGAPTENENELDDANPLFDRVAAAGTEGSTGNNVQIGPPNGANNNVESIDLIRKQLGRIQEEEDIAIKSNLLMKLLEQMPEGPLPVVYIEDAGGNAVLEDNPGGAGAQDEGSSANAMDPIDDQPATDQLTPNANKRSGRYYRRYPWKRQNSRSRTYDADARYLCVPSREDVFKLLVGLHENRIGNHQKTVNFCNRKRPAKAIFTNIRFLG